MIDVIRLNIGGHHYEISRTLLEMCPTSRLAQTVSEQCKDDPNHEVFVDRDGTIFRYVLTYMRDGHVTLPQTETKETLIRELQFYGVEVNEENITERSRATTHPCSCKGPCNFDCECRRFRRTCHAQCGCGGNCFTHCNCKGPCSDECGCRTSHHGCNAGCKCGGPSGGCGCTGGGMRHSC